MPCKDDCSTPPEDACRTQCQDVKMDPLFQVANQIANAAFDAADLSMVEDRLRKEGAIQPDLIAPAVTEYRKFMALIAAGNQGLSMISPIVDEVWHAHILHTMDYAAFCQTMIGRFVHHQPNSDRTPIAASEHPRFIEVYENAFGPLPDVWKGEKQISGCAVV